MTVQAGLCQTWSETQIVGFLMHMLKYLISVIAGTYSRIKINNKLQTYNEYKKKIRFENRLSANDRFIIASFTKLCISNHRLEVEGDILEHLNS